MSLMLIQLPSMDVRQSTFCLLGPLYEPMLIVKGINRAIPDDQFDYFVDKFARRVAGWDHYGITTAKRLINKNSAWPTVEAWEETWDGFTEGLKQPLFPPRLAALIKAGLQKNVTFERNMAETLLEFVGSGPFNA